MNTDRTLVAVFDSAHVRFFEYHAARGHLDAVMEDVKSGLHHDLREIEADRPGRGFSPGGQRHAHESEHDPRKLEKQEFVRAIAGAIEAALDQHQYTKLVIVAPHRSVGEFRSIASDRVTRTIWREIPKELANLSDSELAKHIVPMLQQPPA